MDIGASSMYTTLKKLLDAGLVEMADKETKTYIISAKGREGLLNDYSRRKNIIKQSEEIFSELKGGKQ